MALQRRLSNGHAFKFHNDSAVVPFGQEFWISLPLKKAFYG